jgi:hypothetical protein
MRGFPDCASLHQGYGLWCAGCAVGQNRTNKLGIIGFLDNNQHHGALLDRMQLSALRRRN